MWFSIAIKNFYFSGWIGGNIIEFYYIKIIITFCKGQVWRQQR